MSLKNAHKLVGIAIAASIAWACGSSDDAGKTSGDSDAAVCNNNGTADPGEECDGPDLNGATCSMATNGQRPTGSVRCSSTCTLIDTSCTSSSNTGGATSSTGGAGGTGAGGTGAGGMGAGGTLSTGGTIATGGITSTGGTTANGGTAATGGMTSTGGATACGTMACNANGPCRQAYGNQALCVNLCCQP